MKQTRQYILQHLPHDVVGIVIWYLKSSKSWYEKARNGQYESCMKCPLQWCECALFGACYSGYHHIIDYLLSKHTISVAWALTSYALEKNYINVVGVFLDHGMIILPHIVKCMVMEGNLEMTEFLIRRNIATVDEAYYHACCFKKYDIAQRMLEFGARLI